MTKYSDDIKPFNYGSYHIEYFANGTRTRIKFCKGVYIDKQGAKFAGFQYLDRKATKDNKRPTIKGNSPFWFEPIKS